MKLLYPIPKGQVRGVDAAARVAIERNRSRREDITHLEVFVHESEYQVDITYNSRTLCIGGPEDGNYTTHTGTVFMSANVTYKRLHYPGDQDVYVPAVWTQEDVMRALIAVYGKRQ